MGPGPVPPWFKPMDPRPGILPQFSKFFSNNHNFFLYYSLSKPRPRSRPVPNLVMIPVLEQTNRFRNGSRLGSTMDPDRNRPVYNPNFMV